MFILIQKFVCEECGKEFNTHREALIHEESCFSLQKKQEVELGKVITFLEENYSDQISNAKYEVNEQTVSTTSENCMRRFVTFRLEVTTSKNEEVVITDRDIESGTLIMAHIIIDKFRSKMELLLPLEYEGIMFDNCGYGYSINEIDLNDICSRLVGKKVRFQVID
jgi:hypothetical protein